MKSKFLHICFFESGYPRSGGGGGAGTYVQLVGRELVRRGHRVIAIARWYPGCTPREEDQGVVVYRPKIISYLEYYLTSSSWLEWGLPLPRLLGEKRRLYQYLEKIHRENPVSVAEITEGRDFWHALKPSFPYVAHLHGSAYTFACMTGAAVSRLDWRIRRLQLFGIRRAHWVVSPSQRLLEIVGHELGKPLQRASVIPYPLDPRLVQNRRDQICTADKLIVLFAARNDPVKGGDVLLNAVPIVRKDIPGVEFRFFGYKPEGRELPEGVQCYDFVPKEELINHYQEADLCVVPSYWDNSPNTVYEAMAAGKAVVASRVGGIPELVVDGETGLLVPPGEPRRLARAITVLLLDDARRIRMGERGRERIQAIADLGENVDRRLAVYQQVIVARGTP